MPFIRQAVPAGPGWGRGIAVLLYWPQRSFLSMGAHSPKTAWGPAFPAENRPMKRRPEPDENLQPRHWSHGFGQVVDPQNVFRHFPIPTRGGRLPEFPFSPESPRPTVLSHRLAAQGF